MSEIPPPTIPPATPPPPGGGSYTPPPPPPNYGAGPGGPPSSDRTLMIVLAYLGILALIPYLTKKDDPEVMWHAKNGLGLLIFDIAVSIVFWILGNMLGSVIGCATAAASCLAPFAILALHIYCLIQALGGKRPVLPVITEFAQKTL